MVVLKETTVLVSRPAKNCNAHLRRLCPLYNLNSFKMHYKKNEASNLLPITVTEGLTVNVIPIKDYDYLMTTKEVANGYGVTQYAILKNKLALATELIEGKHYVTAITISNSELPKQLRCAHNAVLWTKRGIVRLGFAMRSERAKLFRDWAEELIIKIDEQTDLFGSVVKPFAQLPSKRKHNRLTQDRLVSILADVCKIENSQLRLSISNKLMGREEHE